VLNGEVVLPEVNQLFLNELKELGYKESDVMKQLNTEEEEQFLQSLPADLMKLFPTALDISHEYHIRHQIAFQKYTDNAVSKTINLPENATAEDVQSAYLMAWRRKAKGITIYRYNSKHLQVLNRTEKDYHIPALFQDGIGACKVCTE
jgi:ribonucleoside-diphosphate reductase alpha chain